MSGIADVSYWGPEAEFYIFNSLRFDQNAHSGYYHTDSEEGIWNPGKNSDPNLAFQPRPQEGYFPVPPHSQLQDPPPRAARDHGAAGEARVGGAEVPAPCGLGVRVPWGGLTGSLVWGWAWACSARP